MIPGECLSQNFVRTFLQFHSFAQILPTPLSWRDAELHLFSITAASLPEELPEAWPCAKPSGRRSSATLSFLAAETFTIQAPCFSVQSLSSGSRISTMICYQTFKVLGPWLETTADMAVLISSYSSPFPIKINNCMFQRTPRLGKNKRLNLF